MESVTSSDSVLSSSSPAATSKSPLVYLDKCVVCDKPASKKCGGCSLAFYCSPQHQRQDWIRHKLDCKPYHVTISSENGGNLALVALKMIPADTLIISEYPLISFEKVDGGGLEKILELAGALPVKCFGCQAGWITSGKGAEELLRCEQCGLPMCQPSCSSPSSHVQGHCKLLQELKIKEKREGANLAEIMEDLRLVELLVKEKRKGTPVVLKSKRGAASSTSVWTPLVKLAKGLKGPENVHYLYPLSVAVAGGTAEGMEVVRLLSRLLAEYSIPVDVANKRKFALFEKHCYLSHSCNPNLECWLDNSGLQLKLHCRVIKSILPGEPLTIFRSSDPTLIYNPTLGRRQKLEKQTLPLSPCTCSRCSDPSELNTHLSAIRCLVCKDVSSQLTCSYYHPSNPLERRSNWICSGKQCRSTKTFEQILVINLKAEKELEAIWKAAAISSTPSTCETVLTKLQSFIVRHQRKILHPNHCLILICRSRINKVVSNFLGAGDKLFLCVVSNQPRAYDYCAYKVEHLHSYLNFINKLYDYGTTRVSGKLLYELVFCEGALVFRDFAEERMGGSSFFRRLHGVMENVQKCQKSLAAYQDCQDFVEGVKQFGQMLRKLLGQDFMSPYKMKMLQNSSKEEESLREQVKKAIDKWTGAVEEIGLNKEYISPGNGKKAGESGKEEGKETKGGIGKDELHTILMDVPAHKY